LLKKREKKLLSTAAKKREKLGERVRKKIFPGEDWKSLTRGGEDFPKGAKTK